LHVCVTVKERESFIHQHQAPQGTICYVSKTWLIHWTCLVTAVCGDLAMSCAKEISAQHAKSPQNVTIVLHKNPCSMLIRAAVDGCMGFYESAMTAKSTFRMVSINLAPFSEQMATKWSGLKLSSTACIPAPWSWSAEVSKQLLILFLQPAKRLCACLQKSHTTDGDRQLSRKC